MLRLNRGWNCCQSCFHSPCACGASLRDGAYDASCGHGSARGYDGSENAHFHRDCPSLPSQRSHHGSIHSDYLGVIQGSVGFAVVSVSYLRA